MKYFFGFIIIIFINACSVKYDSEMQNQSEYENKRVIEKLQKTIQSLSLDVNESEAKKVASIAVLYSKFLAHEYKLVKPPLYHNTLIQLGLKERGLCFHFAEDLIKELKKQDLKTLDLRWVVHKKADYWEHSSIVVSAKNQPIQNGIILDAWRDSGKLYWNNFLKDTRYIWIEDTLRSKYYGNVK